MAATAIYPHAAADLPALLARLGALGLLHRVAREVDPTWELSAVARQMFLQSREQDRYTILFERVRGYRYPVVVGALGVSRAAYAAALGIAPEEILERWATALHAPLAPRFVEGGLVDETVWEGDAVDLTALPAIVWTPGHDGGAYIAGPYCVTRDLETGVVNIAMRRMMLKDRRRLAFNIRPHARTDVNGPHSSWEAAKYEARDEPMPVAVVIGCEPAVGFVSAAKVPYGAHGVWSDYGIAGALGRRPIDLIACRTVPLHVPASAQIVLEGWLAPHHREPEGPFGEYFGYMNRPAPKPILEVSCIRLRRDPLVQFIHSQKPPSESMLVSSIGNAGVLYSRLVHDLDFREVVDVHIPDHLPMTHFVLQARRISRGYATQVLHAASTVVPGISGKVLTLVDEDIDIRDVRQVEWAVHTRVQPHRDVTVMRHTKPLFLDPSVAAVASEEAEASKLLIDATCKWDYPPPSLPPADMLAEVRATWDSYGLPPLT